MVLSKLNTSPNRVLESVRATLAASGANLAAVSLPNDDAPVPTMIDSSNPQATRGNILLVEDHSDLGALLVFLLQRAGHQVTNVKTPAEALQQVSEQSFDLFVLGRNCADRAVLPLSTQIRQSRPDKPIIVYSTAALFSEQQDGLRAGATAYLAKPEDLFNVGQIASDLIKSQARPGTHHIRAA